MSGTNLSYAQMSSFTQSDKYLPNKKKTFSGKQSLIITEKSASKFFSYKHRHKDFRYTYRHREERHKVRHYVEDVVHNYLSDDFQVFFRVSRTTYTTLLDYLSGLSARLCSFSKLLLE